VEKADDKIQKMGREIGNAKMKRNRKPKKLYRYNVYIRPWAWDVFEVWATSGKEACQKIRDLEGEQICSVTWDDVPKNRKWERMK
jgi:hypothetical protein